MLLSVQAECLMRPGVLRGRNLVFSAPTSAGKTIVYEVLALRRLITTQRPFMLVLPTVALCEQKVGQHQGSTARAPLTGEHLWMVTVPW